MYKKKLFAKRAIVALLVLCIILGVMPVTGIMKTQVAKAGTAGHTSDDAIAWAASKVGQALDYDGQYGAQCVDFIAFYYKYLGANPPWGNADSYTWNALPGGWSRIQGAVPQKGDILVYTGGAYGHVAIFESTNVTYHQNYGGQYVRRMTFTYNDMRYLPGMNYWGVVRPDFAVPAPPARLGYELPTGAPQTVSDGDYFIVSALEGDRYNPGQKCLTIGGLPNAKNNNEANAELWSVYGWEGHLFTVTWLGNGFYKIKLKDSDNKCLDVAGADNKMGANVQQWVDNGTTAQQWQINQTSDGNGYTLQARCNAWYLDVEGGNTANATNIRMWEGNGSNAQRWFFVPYGGGSSARQEIADGEYHIAAKMDLSKTLTAAGNGTTDGTNVQLWSSRDDASQTFNVRWLGNGYYEITHKRSGLTIEVIDAWSLRGANVQLYRRKNISCQKWIIRSCGNGYFNIISQCNGLYLDATDAKTDNGTNIQMCVGWVFNGADCQQWQFIPYTPIVDVQSVTLDATSIMLEKDQQPKLQATVFPADATNKTITWASDNTSVATVDSNGFVTAKSVGTAIITATSSNGKSASCKVTVQHTHTYGNTWKSDEQKHWKECTCGENLEETHMLEWVTDKEATKETAGLKHEECKVCGYKQSIDTIISPTGTDINSVATNQPKPSIDPTATPVGTNQPKPSISPTVTPVATNQPKPSIDPVATNQPVIDPCDHVYETTITPATMEDNGSVMNICSICGDEEEIVISAVKNIVLSKTSSNYSGKVQKPRVTVEDSSDATLEEGTDYEVSYQASMKNVGRYTVTVTFMGNYEGKEDLTYDIGPAGTTLSELTAKKKGFTVKWQKQTAQTSGYEIVYSTSSHFTKTATKTVVIGQKTATSRYVSGLNVGKKYYVRIRTYKNVHVDKNTVKLYSNWSKVKVVTIKK